jgi:hypothetical protein
MLIALTTALLLASSDPVPGQDIDSAAAKAKTSFSLAPPIKAFAAPFFGTTMPGVLPLIQPGQGKSLTPAGETLESLKPGETGTVCGIRIIKADPKLDPKFSRDVKSTDSGIVRRRNCSPETR